MTAPKMRRIDDVLAGYGIVKITKLESDKPVCVREIGCSICAARASTAFRPNMPPEVIVRNFQNKGWIVSAKANCPRKEDGRALRIKER